MKKIQQIEDTEKHLVESKLEKFFFFFELGDEHEVGWVGRCSEPRKSWRREKNMIKYIV